MIHQIYYDRKLIAEIDASSNFEAIERVFTLQQKKYPNRKQYKAQKKWNKIKNN